MLHAWQKLPFTQICQHRLALTAPEPTLRTRNAPSKITAAEHHLLEEPRFRGLRLLFGAPKSIDRVPLTGKRITEGNRIYRVSA